MDRQGEQPRALCDFIGCEVLQALAMAGGLNPFAKRGDIKIFRETGGGTKVFFFDYDTVADGKDSRQNMRLKKGDVIVVP
jgi:polysaccharide export outer membrane protein